MEPRRRKWTAAATSIIYIYVNKDETKVVKERYQLEQESAEFMLQDFTGILNGPGRKRR